MNYRSGVSGVPKCADPAPSTHTGTPSTSSNTKASAGGSTTGGGSGVSGNGGSNSGSAYNSNSGSGAGTNCNGNGSNANYTSVNPASSVAAGAHAAGERVKGYMKSSSCSVFSDKKSCMLIGAGMVLAFLAGAASLYLLQRYEESLDDKPASPEDRKPTRTFSPRAAS